MFMKETHCLSYTLFPENMTFFRNKVCRFAGVHRTHVEPIREQWSPESGRSIFWATMSLNRFKDILRFLRFDNTNTRAAMRETDKLTVFRDVWEIFLGKLQRCYIPGPDMTVDEQLVPFR